MPSLVVVMVNWNTSGFTRDCLHTVFPALEGIDAEVWMVDNASHDDSIAMLREAFPQVKLIENEENVGFARANNQILREAHADYYLLLNTDTIVPENSIRELYLFLKNHPEYGAVGPKLKNAEGVVEPPYKRLPSLVGELRYCLVSHFVPFTDLFRALLPTRSVPEEMMAAPHPAEVLSAACLMIRREVIEKVGLLAEDYFLFSEENDYFLRMSRDGFAACYLPATEVIHLLGVSRKKRGSIDSEINFFRSRQLWFRKHFFGQLILFKLIYLPFFCWSLGVALVRRLLLGRRASEGLELYTRLWAVWWSGA